MSLTAGTASLQAVGSSTANLLATAATGGTAPVTYQWYRDTVTGFTPGGGNIIAGATALALADTGLIPNTTYFYILQATDAVPATVSYTEVPAVTAAAQLSQNQFSQTPYIGVLDLRLDFNTVAVQVDPASATAIFPGQVVKLVDKAGGVPKVVAAASGDTPYGVLNYSTKDVSFAPGRAVEMSMAGNCVWLYATEAIARGGKVQADYATVGGVKTTVATVNSVGWAYDKATAPGQLIRVILTCPAFT